MNPVLDPAQLPLRDIHLPEAIGLWPPAFGWWILVGAVLVGMVFWALRYRAGWRPPDCHGRIEGGAGDA